jgi:hypothetical protein
MTESVWLLVFVKLMRLLSNGVIQCLNVLVRSEWLQLDGRLKMADSLDVCLLGLFFRELHSAEP